MSPDALDLSIPLDRSGDPKPDPLLPARIHAHAAEVRALRGTADLMTLEGDL